MRALIAYGVSLLLHVGVITWLGLASGDPPRPWQLRPGRASIEILGSFADRAPGSSEMAILILPAIARVSTTGSERSERYAKLPAMRKRVAADRRNEVQQVPTPPLVQLPERRAVPHAAQTLLAGATSPELDLTRSQFALDGGGGESGSSRASSGTQVDAPPTQVITNPQPPYPAAELAAGHEGRVLLRVRIDADGVVRQATVARSSGHMALDESARSTVVQWRFEPAQRAGIPAEWEGLIPIRFRIGSGE